MKILSRSTLAALILVTAVPAMAQSLAELAAKEKERREKAKAAATKTYTEEDLKNARGTGITITSTPAPSPSPGASRTHPRSSGEGTSGASAEEQQWRSEAQTYRDAVADAEKAVADAQQQKDTARTGVSQPLPIDGTRQLPPLPLVKEGGQVAADQALAEAQAALAKARADQAAFEERARKAGALPGWLR